MTNFAIRPCFIMLLAGLALPAAAKPPEDWDGIQCGTEIAKALVGRKMHNLPVAETEKRYAQLSLKDLGADEVAEGLNLVTWQACGEVLLVLTKGTRILDALQLPAGAKQSPPVLTTCTLEGKEIESVLPVFKGGEEGKAGKVEQAWAVRGTPPKIIAQEPAGLVCHRD